MRTVADGAELLAYFERAGATEGAVTPGAEPDRDRRHAARHARAMTRPPAQGRPAHAPDPARGPRRRRRPTTVAAAYDAGANTYIVKPVTFLALVRLMKVFTAYWLETAELPTDQEAA